MMMCFFWWFLFRSISFVFSIYVYGIYNSCWFYLTSIVCDDLGLLHDCSFRYSNWKWFSRLKELVEEPYKLPIFIFPEGTCIHQHQRHAVQEGKLRGRGYSFFLSFFGSLFISLSLYLCLSLSLSFSLSLFVSLSLCLSLSFSFSFDVSLSVSLFVSLYLSFFLSVSLFSPETVSSIKAYYIKRNLVN